MKDDKVFVRVLRPGDYYHTWFAEGEVLLCWKEHAEEWEQREMVKILTSQAEVFKDSCKALIREMPLIGIQILLEDAVYEVSKEQMGSDEKGKIGWIEEIHRKPMRDGRKRTIDLIFMPYCKNVLKLDEDETAAWILRWVKKCDTVSPTRMTDTMIRQKYRRTRSAS